MIDVEAFIFEKHQNVDANYRTKVTDFLANVKFL